MATLCKEFGERVRARRLAQGMTLRAFCREAEMDPGNVSRIERGKSLPPKGEALSNYLDALGMEAGSEERNEFGVLADACRGEVPEEIMSDEELVKKLPVVFRTLGSKGPTAEQIDELIDLLRKS